ncbi:M48 family metallopeptidase [Sphingomonas sp.]|uniref:M48 family metallopeptidase n=1 Tax=Sphingomonas sp. TaxID=28214 RepID=UPI002DD67C5C|nr:M48 family metallopeptidase [Sphingomonas sp.]
MRSMSARSDVVVGHYDGLSGVRRRPVLMAEGDHFHLIDDDRRDGPFAFAMLTALGAHDGVAQYGLKGRPGWRIDIELPLPEGLATRLPGEVRYGGFLDRVGLWGGAAICAAIAAVTVFTVAQIPTLAARFVPREAERRLGDLMVGDFGNRTCEAPAGKAALEQLVTRLGPDARIADIRVVNVGMVNAVALPGGHVLVFEGLLRRAQSPDEVAGVIAHELGHVEHRDVLAALIRQMGLSVVLGGLGGDVGGWVNTVLAAGYSREAESRADGYAIDVLGEAGVSARGTADFFARMAKGEAALGKAGRLAVYMSTHPMSDERRQRFEGKARAQANATPALDARQWRDLRAICRDDPDVSKSEMRF